VQIPALACRAPKDSANDGRHLSCSLTNRCDLHSLAAELSITCLGFEAHPCTLSLSEQNLHTPTQNWCIHIHQYTGFPVTVYSRWSLVISFCCRPWAA
ncbi:Copper-importing ATPase, partial [Giardia duodenalis]